MKADFARYRNMNLTTAARHQMMANRALQVCDGLGVARLLRKLGLAKIHLKKATEQDIRTQYKWQSNPEIRKFSRNPKPVS